MRPEKDEVLLLWRGASCQGLQKIYQEQSQIQIKDNGPQQEIQKQVQAGNISINQMASVPELTYLVEQSEQLLGSLGLGDSVSNWLEAGIKEVTIDEASLVNVIFCVR